LTAWRWLAITGRRWNRGPAATLPTRIAAQGAGGRPSPSGRDGRRASEWEGGEQETVGERCRNTTWGGSSAEGARREGGGRVKDRLGEQRGGSEWEPIKFFSKEIETPTR
jgi:hypothetical protein